MQEEAEVVRQGGGGSKADKEKIKKAAAKARNLIRKLLRGAAEKSNDMTHGEYGSLTNNDVELLCSNAKTDELNAICNGLGGDPAAKDNSLLLLEGMVAVQAAIEKAKQMQVEAAEDEAIAKEAKKREADEKNISTKKSNTNNKDAVPADRILSEEEKLTLSRAITRYPAGTANRWQTVANYMNVTLKPPLGEGFKAEELLRLAYKMSVNASTETAAAI